MRIGAAMILCAGVVVGLVMAAVIFYQPWCDFADAIPCLTPIYSVVHTPAQLMAEAWFAVGLPPHGDAALLLYPLAVVVQWILLGALGAWLYRRRQSKG